jgi:hypothetical protein
MTPCSLVKFTKVSEECIASFFRVQKSVLQTLAGYVISGVYLSILMAFSLRTCKLWPTNQW